MFGLTTNYNIKSFIQNFQNLIRSIVKSIVDQFMQWLTKKIRKILEPLCIKFKLEVELEQVEYYARLIKQILQHLRLLTKCGETLGWTQDEVTSADIVSSEDTQEIINEC